VKRRGILLFLMIVLIALCALVQKAPAGKPLTDMQILREKTKADKKPGIWATGRKDVTPMLFSGLLLRRVILRHVRGQCFYILLGKVGTVAFHPQDGGTPLGFIPTLRRRLFHAVA
jgi:hypothetical protein